MRHHTAASLCFVLLSSWLAVLLTPLRVDAAPKGLQRGLWFSARLLALALVLFAAGALTTHAAGSVSLTALGSAYTQDFNTLASSGTSSTVPTGWDFTESGTNANALYTAGTGSSNTGDTYSFGATANTERAFGGLRSGNLIPLIGAQFTNNTSGTITSLTISYTGEQWRLGQNTTGRAADRLDFQLSTNATSLTTGTWVDHDALDFPSPVVSGTVGALNGNVAPNRTALSFTISGLSIPNGATFWIRWADSDLIPGSDDGLSVDDFSLTPFGTVADPAPFVSSSTPTNGATNVARNSDITLTFSEAVNVSGAWFTISCANSGAHTAAVSGGPTTFTLNPDVDFGSNEVCTVNVIAAQVSDVDTDDPPDNMTADHTFNFTTVNQQACGDPATLIHDIQGSGTTSPLNGATGVSIEGIVVGDYQASGQFSGYHVQEEDADADGDPATSEGIFVFNTAFAVNAGDKVRVTGNVTEFNNLTELASVTNVLVCSSGNSVGATAIPLPIPSIGDWERYEGMLVNFSQQLTVTENFTLGRFGEVMLSSDGRLLNPTHVTSPGAPAVALQADNDRRRITLDDANNLQNIDPTLYPGGGLSAFNTLRSGYTVDNLTGVLEQRFGVYRLQPVGAINFNADNPRPSAPDNVGGTLKVVAANVLNYFNGDGLGGGFPTPRGANTSFEFTRQRDKIINALAAMDADIVGLMEIENDATPNSAIQDLVAGLNSALGAGTYDFIDTGIVGTDQIRVALIYKPGTITPVGNYAILTTAVDPRFLDTKNRPALAQTFLQNATGGKFTVVVNHLKSKGSACDDVGDPDTGDGQGNCNGTRTQAAAALVDWIASDPTGSGDPDAIIIGDLNAYAKEDPITTLQNGGYTNLIAQFLGDDAYSFVFGGQAGYLDHALANTSLAPQVTGVTEWHINADEPIVLDYNVEFKTANQVNTFYSPDPFRVSDHDSLIVGFDLLNAAPSVDAGGPYKVVEGQSVVVDATGDDPEGDTVSFEWDLDNNGSFETAGQSVTFDASGLTAPSTHTIRVRASDSYGNSAIAETTVDVIFAFNGFFPPVDNRPIVNVAKAGSSVPVKFSLGGDQGLNIFADGYPKSETIPCDSNADTDGIEETVTPGSSGLHYDPGTDTYNYVWKTKKGWAGTCRQLILKFVDGTSHRANFQFK